MRWDSRQTFPRADKQLRLLEQVASMLPGERDPLRIEHSVAQLLRQRVYGVVQGYEDLNDHDRLRHDLALQSARGKASQGA